MRQPVTIPGRAAPDLPMSPAIRSGGHLFLTGMTGSGPDGAMPEGMTAQAEAIFDKVAAVLAAGGADLGAVVEMTSDHVGMEATFDAFLTVLRARFDAPYPAWTAVEVAGLRRPGALVELRVVAAAPSGA